MTGRVLVTGGAGFIGSNLCEMLVSEGFQVTVLDNLSSGDHNLGFITDLGVDLIIGDICDSELVFSQVSRAEVVVNLAAFVSVQDSFTRPKRNWQTNVDGTMNIIRACEKIGSRRLIHASSAAVYGDISDNPSSLPLIEGSTGNQLSPYAESKTRNELDIESSRERELDAVSLRFFNVYGPRQRTNGDYSAAIPIFIEKLQNSENPIIFGDGLQTRDFIHVSDVCEAILAIIKSKATIRHSVYNIASGKQTSLIDLINIIEDSMNRIVSDWKGIEVQFTTERSGDIRHSVACVDRFSSDFEWSPKVSIINGIFDLVSISNKNEKPSVFSSQMIGEYSEKV